MYQPVLGRFASRDPLPPESQPDILYDNNWFGDRLTRMRNLYGYVDNNPLNMIDPSGLRCEAAKPPDTIIPIDDDYFQSGTVWKPQPPRGAAVLHFWPVCRRRVCRRLRHQAHGIAPTRVESTNGIGWHRIPIVRLGTE